MPDPTLYFVSSILGMFTIILGFLVAGFGVLTPWAYTRNLLGIQDAVVDWFGWLPGVNDGLLRVEAALAALLVLALAAGVFWTAFALIPYA